MVLSRFAFALLLLLASSRLSAQVQDVFSTEHDKFIQDFLVVLARDAGLSGRDLSLVLDQQWHSEIQPEEKDKFITIVNVMVSKKYTIPKEIVAFTRAFSVVKRADNYVRLNSLDFLDVSLQTVATMDQKQLVKFWENLGNYLPQGYPVQRNRFSWRMEQDEPRIEIVELPDKKTGSMELRPMARFRNTTVTYRGNSDSTVIENTNGDLDLVTLDFLGIGGTVNWEKVKLPKGDVYALLSSYILNLNYGAVEADSVSFFYKSLFNEPLIGRFEDKGLGHQNINTANYPYFKSYGGGVVIENLIPDVRYEGGFSLKGVRRIGSGYDVYIEEEIKSDEGPFTQDYYEDVQHVEEERQEMLDEFYSNVQESESTNYETNYDEYYNGTPDPSVTDAQPETGGYEREEDPWSTENGEGDENSASAANAEDNLPTNNGAVSPPEKLTITKKIHRPAKLQIKRGEGIAMTLRGEEITLDLEKLVAKNMDVSLYLGEGDSIYSPSMDVLFEVETKQVLFKKPRKTPFAETPWESNYHQYYLYFEAIEWNLDSNIINFTAFIDKEHKVAAIESFDFFNKQRLARYKGAMNINPLGAIYRYKIEGKADVIYARDVMRYFNNEQFYESFEHTLPRLQSAGYIRYTLDPDRINTKTNKVQPDYMIEPLSKMYDWMRAARNRKDYDAIMIFMQVDSGYHARLDMTTNNMELFGVSSFSVSDSQFVAVQPEGKVIVREDRDLEFGGKMGAGRMDFYTSQVDGFKFDYESYSVACDNIDSMRFVLVRNPPPGYEYSPLERALSNTVFEKVKGKIHIDDPTNKNGQNKKRFPYFPVFDSYEDCYVYWARPEIQSGVYAKELLNFSVDPFVLDSLENFNESNLHFDGEFNSGGIFPSFRQQLTVMEDFSLGFKQQAPLGGYPVYNGAGKFDGEITMDSYGLHSKGDLDFLGGIASSDTFVFHFDSVMAVTSHYKIDKGLHGKGRFPEIEANVADFHWYTQEGRQTLSSMEEPISVYGGRGKITGTVTITEAGSWAKGSIEIGQTKINSDSIVLDEEEFRAFDSDFIITDKNDPTLTHFQVREVSIAYDVTRKISTFERATVSDSTLAEFPIHQYNTSLVKGVYQEMEDNLVLNSVSNYSKSNYFISVDEGQDSLNFSAGTASYNTQTQRIEIEGVPNILVADARISPAEQHVVIQGTGKLETLENAVVEVGEEKDGIRAHRMYEAKVDINSRHDYTGAAKYDYNGIKEKEQFIIFDNVVVRKDTITIGSGEVGFDKPFYISDRILFRGKASLDAQEKFLEFEGEVSIEVANAVFKGIWMKYGPERVNPDSVLIPIDEKLANEEGQKLLAGLNFIMEGKAFYTTFMQPLRNETDMAVLTAGGFLTFDRKSKEFRIGSKRKLQGLDYKGTLLTYNDSLGIISAEGLMDFPYDFGESCGKMTVTGSWMENQVERKQKTSLFIGLDAGAGLLPRDPVKNTVSQLTIMTEGQKYIDFKRRDFISYLSNLLDRETPDERNTYAFLEEERNILAYYDLSLAASMPYTLFLGDVNFQYDKNARTLYCKDQVALIGIQGLPLYKYMKSCITYELRDVDQEGNTVNDKFTIYLYLDDLNYMYFCLEGEVLRVRSSYYDTWNYPIQAEVDRRGAPSQGCRLEIAEDDEVLKFKKNFGIKYGDAPPPKKKPGTAGAKPGGQ